METYARPVLFGGMVLVLADHLLLGQRFGTYATYSSGPDVSYSDLYYDYGINLLWGLSQLMVTLSQTLSIPSLRSSGCWEYSSLAISAGGYGGNTAS
mgnify:CR=1 FL=1